MAPLAFAAPHEQHRCSGCGHQWDGPLRGAELCGDCWWKAQSAVHAAPPAEPHGNVTDMETGMRYHVLGRRMVEGHEWIDLALPDSQGRARSVRRSLFDRIFAAPPAQEDQ